MSIQAKVISLLYQMQLSEVSQQRQVDERKKRYNN